MATNDEIIETLFDELVPPTGSADTVAGEIIRAFCRIEYRNYNDGDHIGVGYGNETCNAAARFLQQNCNSTIKTIIEDMWGIYDDNKYDSLLKILEKEIIKYINEHPELKTTPNNDDMFNYKEYEDTHYEDDEDEYYENEDDDEDYYYYDVFNDEDDKDEY